MSVDSVNSVNFKGKLIILNDLSHKPYSCIKKVEDNLRKQIQSKDYDLYIEQDYSSNKIRVAVSSLHPAQINGILTQEELPITAKHSRYIYAAQNAIKNHENSLNEIEQKEWETRKKRQKIDDIKDMAGTFLIFPLFVINHILHSMNPKWAKKFEKNVLDGII